MKKNNFMLLLLILLGLQLRLLSAFFPGFRIDVDTWFAWAIRINQVGLASFYSDQIWTNYTPGFLYILKLLGFVKIIFNLSDSLFYLILKIPSILAEILLGLFIYRLVYIKSLLWARIAAGAILLNPVFIFNSAIWGQIDGLLSLLMILSVYLLVKQKLILSSVLLGLSFLVKPQAIGLLPVFILYLVKDFSVKNSFKIILPAILSVFILSLPFYTDHIFGLPSLFSKMVGDYSYTSLFAYNFWGVVGFWINDNILWNYLPYHWWGYILYCLFWCLLSYLYFRKKISIYSLATLAMLSFFFLPTRVHERYLYPGLTFLIILIGIYKSKILLVLTSLLSIVHFLNLYFVYVYYNEIYLKLPKIFYNPMFYNFLDNNGTVISLISTLLFLCISIIIIKHEVYKRDHS